MPAHLTPQPSATPQRRRFWLALAVLAGACAVLAWRWQAQREVAPPTKVVAAKTQQPQAPQQAPAPPAAESSGCPLELGKDYAFTGTATAMGSQGPLPEAAATWRLALRGVSRDANGRTVLAGRIRAAAGATTPLPSGAEQPFLLALGPDCRQEAYAWRDAADLGGARWQQAHLALFNYVLPKQADTPQLGEAADENGRYRFAAVRSATPGGAVVRVRNRGYLGAAASLKRESEPGVVVDGRGLVVHLSDKDGLREADLQQTVRAPLAAAAAITVHATLLADPQGESMDVAGIAADAPGWTWGNLLTDPAARRRARLGSDPRLVGMAAATLLQLLAEADPEGEALESGIRQIEAWLLANPGAAAELGQWLAAQSERYGENRWARLALAALGRCGLPAARLALRGLAAGEKLAPALRLHALLQLAGAEGVDRDDVAAVTQLARQRVAHGGDTQATMASATALSALGIMARGTSLQGTESQKQIVGMLQDALQHETDPAYLIAAVNGAGNAAAAELLPDLQNLSANADLDVRRRVADALRGMPLEASEAWLSAWLGHEDAPQVAVALLGALAGHYGGDDLLPAGLALVAEQRLATEANSAVAVQLASLLGQASASSLAAKAALVARFGQEFARGSAGNADLMLEIGRYVDAATLVAAH